MTNKEQILHHYKSTADMIVETFGENCEVVIHDLTNLNESLIYIKGNVTERQLGAPATDLILKELYRFQNDVKDKFGFMARTSSGKIIKTSMTFIRDNDENVIGCLGINFDITDLIMATRGLQSICKTSGIETIDQQFTEEYYPKSIEDVFQHVIDQTVQQFNVFGSSMSREDKLRFVRMLDEKGIFMIQGAIEKASEILHVSKQSVYNYLDEIRSIKS
ncbi:helix-turn-helix transcriptional regulator [Terrilactibacillus tamarindi]|uniref:helix-turn-helix transcriptional regulator n=1 Tax=Terrilactibacillus tamarindi TaxID=2599694 RepID=UPI002E311C64|nr:helix-turn-helix transcriptional regulator [Terrilactibacillus tamarindi]